MSLVFYITPRSVRVQKHHLEFTLNLPPENLTRAALEAYSLLQQSVSTQTDSTREEREEALTLLKYYGHGLFDAIVPPALRPHIYKEGSIYIYSVYPGIINLPWELLFDGSSFFALTQGVVRINESKPAMLATPVKKKKGVLKVSLNAYSPLLPGHKSWRSGETFSLGNRFVSPVEELPGDLLIRSEAVQFQVSGNCSQESIQLALEREPDIFLFSGYHTPDGWVVDKDNENFADLNWFRCQFQPALREAVEKGMKLLILNTSSLVESKSKDVRGAISSYFDQGIPYVITIGGRVARHRVKSYFQNFINGLIHGESILKAHRHALNKITSSLPLAWDWSWIQLHFNKRFLESSMELPTSSFEVEASEGLSQLYFDNNYLINNHRRFIGNYDLYKKISQTLLDANNQSVIIIESDNGFYQEEYLQEFFRRLAAEKRFNLSVLYYNEYRIGADSDPKTEIGKRQFASLYSLVDANRYYDESLIRICENSDRLENNRFLVIYYPPKAVDPDFDAWVQEKLSGGWKVIMLACDRYMGRLPKTEFTTDVVAFTEVIAAFEDTLPENWIKTLGNGLSRQMENIALLWIVKNFNYPYLTDLFCSNQCSEVLWESTFSTILPKLSVTRLKLFMTLVLMRVKCSKVFLSNLFKEQKVQEDLEYLCGIHLIDRNLTSTHYWAPVHIVQQIWKYQLISKKKIETAGLEILQRYTAILDTQSCPPKVEVMGFQVLVNTLLRLEVVEEPLLRLLQFCQKLGSQVETCPVVFIRKLLMSLEISLIKSDQIPPKMVLHRIASVLEKLPYISQTVDVYRWLLKREEKQKNWQNVAELQKKLALIFVRVDEKEKAIGLLTSAIQLNKDIKSFAHRYNNLISIALLLIDIGEVNKVAKLVSNTNFDVELLSKEHIDQLWLIDGHILYSEKKYPEAFQSFSKISKLAGLKIENSLRAKTYAYLSELYTLQGDDEKGLQLKSQSATFFLKAGKDEMARDIYAMLYHYYNEKNEIPAALSHLECLFDLFVREDDRVKIQEIAHELGGLYFKTGDKEKSTRFYKIAQGLQGVPI